MNDFVLVADDPQSTFSVDVDTASYAQARRALRSGHLPPLGSVRVEEFVNTFPYDYAPPASGPAPEELDHQLGDLRAARS